MKTDETLSRHRFTTLTNESETEQAEHFLTPDMVIEEFGFGRFQYSLMMITGFYWIADAMVKIFTFRLFWIHFLFFKRKL